MSIKSIANKTESYLAEESSYIAKAREKLLKQLSEQDNKATPEALKKAHETIKNHLSRHSEGRIRLKDRNVKVEDSQVVNKLHAKLVAQSNKDSISPGLSGRITSR